MTVCFGLELCGKQRKDDSGWWSSLKVNSQATVQSCQACNPPRFALCSSPSRAALLYAPALTLGAVVLPGFAVLLVRYLVPLEVFFFFLCFPSKLFLAFHGSFFSFALMKKKKLSPVVAWSC